MASLCLSQMLKDWAEVIKERQKVNAQMSLVDFIKLMAWKFKKCRKGPPKNRCEIEVEHQDLEIPRVKWSVPQAFRRSVLRTGREEPFTTSMKYHEVTFASGALAACQLHLIIGLDPGVLQ